MRHETLSVETAAPAARVIEFLARPETLPDWAFHYCRSVASQGKHTMIEMTNGQRNYFEPRADPATGVVDLHSGPEPDPTERLPMRVLPLGEKRSLVVTTMLMPSAMPAAEFTQLVGFLREELDRLAELVAQPDAQSV